MENKHTAIKELAYEELQIVAGGDKYDELYDEFAELDDFASSMKCFVISGRRFANTFEYVLNSAIDIWGDVVSPEEIEAFVRFIYDD